MLNPDFSDMLSALSAENAEFLVVGGYALSAHGYPLATRDIDILSRTRKPSGVHEIGPMLPSWNDWHGIVEARL